MCAAAEVKFVRLGVYIVLHTAEVESVSLLGDMETFIYMCIRATYITHNITDRKEDGREY